MEQAKDNASGGVPAMLTVKHFAERSGLAQGTIENLIRSGRLKAYSIAGTRYVPSASITQLSEILDRVIPRIKQRSI